MSRFRIGLIIIVTLMTVFYVVARSGKQARAGEPPIFASMSLDEGLAAIKATDKLLIVDVWAPWCPPCISMKESTWRDSRLETWAANHAVTIAINSDDSGNQLAGSNVTALPTVLIFAERSGVAKEVARVVGFKSAEELLDLLKPLAMAAK